MELSIAQDVAKHWEAAMRRGDWEEAWRQTDRIELPRRARQHEPGFVRQPHHLRWDGTPFAGRRLLVRCEHGLGDTLQFIRYVPLVVQQASEVHVLMQPKLLRLFEGAQDLGNVRNGWTEEPPPAHDVEIEVMELAYAFRSTPQTLPPPYRLPGLIRLSPNGHPLQVGLLWAASDWGRSRSIPLSLLEPLFDTGIAHFHSLQYGNAKDDADGLGYGIAPLSAHNREIDAVARAIRELDLVICVDAMSAHLAAMLDVPTWVLLQHRGDWRWMDQRTDSPWYPTVRLFRQPREGDWSAVVAEVKQSLLDFH